MLHRPVEHDVRTQKSMSYLSSSEAGGRDMGRRNRTGLCFEYLKSVGRGLAEQLSDRINNYKVQKKLHMLYICCVLIPLVITDSVILAIVLRSDSASRKHELENIANAVRYSIAGSIDTAAMTVKDIYMNKYINNFLDGTYESALDYYNHYRSFMKDSLFESSMGSSSSTVTMYADNDTIINGGEFARLEGVKDTEWYQYLDESGQDIVLYTYYDESNTPAVEAKRKISLIRRMNFYKREGCEKIIKLDLDYSGIVRDLMQMNYDAPVYICSNRKILFSNDGNSSVGKDFEIFDMQADIGYEEGMVSYGQGMDIYVLRKSQSAWKLIWSNLPLILFLICINAFLPWMFMKLLNRSFTERLQELSSVFDKIEGDNLQEIQRARGSDELGMLMRNYNKMAGRINELIQTVYKDRLKEQEMDIARQNAELLALHSQITPHFLFNALESIRMHSILKKEMETAHMVEMLAVMERQYVDWGTDLVTIKEELNFAQAYLELQKYRFGERLSYKIEMEDGCSGYYIPKLSVVTFVENACVHGIENKSTPGWVFVRVYMEKEKLCLEVEDTGNGIDDALLRELQYNMSHCGIASLKKKGQVGIMNACLRLRMVTGDAVIFALESEAGAGTSITIQMPVNEKQTTEQR